MGYFSFRRRKPPHVPAPIHPVSWRFLDFSADIRNLIYHHLLVDNFFGSICLIERSARRKHLSPEIMRTCRQIHDEAVYILYGRNYFTFEINYDNSSDFFYCYIDNFLCLKGLHHAPLMQNWRILIKKSEYTRPGQISHQETIPWRLRKICMTFRSLKIHVSNLFVYVEESLPLINFPQLDLLSPLKEVCVSGKVSIDVISQHVAPYESSVFEYFRNMKVIMKKPSTFEGLNAILQEDARVVQSRFFIQDLETVAKIFQKNIHDERCITELQDILRMLEHDRTKEVLQSPKRIVRKELCQYLGLLEDIFNHGLHRRMKARSNFDFDANDGDLIAMSKARRWLYMRPEYLAWIQRHDRNAHNSRGPIYYQKDDWDSSRWHKQSNDPIKVIHYCSCPRCSHNSRSERAEVESRKPSPSSSDVLKPSRSPPKIPFHSRNERYAVRLEDLYCAEDMTPGLRDQASTCTFKFRVSHRQHKQGISSKKQRQKKPRQRKWVASGGKKLGDCLGFYEECF